MQKSLQEIQEEIIVEFELVEDWMDKYEMIMDMGNASKGLSEAEHTDDHLVRGCQSKVWIKPRLENEMLFFDFDSDALITKGIAALIIQVVNGRKPEEIAYADLYFIEKIGLKQHLSPNRANGLVSMLQKIKTYALTHVKTIGK